MRDARRASPEAGAPQPAHRARWAVRRDSDTPLARACPGSPRLYQCQRYESIDFSRGISVADNGRLQQGILVKPVARAKATGRQAQPIWAEKA